MSSTRKSTRRKPSTTSRYSSGGEKVPKRPRITKPIFVEVGPKFGGGRGKRQTYMIPGNEDEEGGPPTGIRANSQFSSAYAIRSPPRSPRQVTTINSGFAISTESPQSDDPLSNLNAPTVTETQSARRILTRKSVPVPSTNADEKGSVGAHFSTPEGSANKHKKRRLDYTQTADSLDYHDSAQGMLAERLSRSRSRSIGRDLESPNDHVGVEKASISPSRSAVSSSLSSLSSLPSSNRSSPISINSDSPQKADLREDNRSDRSSPINPSTDDNDDPGKPTGGEAKASPVLTWKTGEEKRGGKRPITFKKATYGVNGKGGCSTVPYAKELMKSHPPFKLKPRLSQRKSFGRALSRAEKRQEELQEELQEETETVPMSTVATRVRKYKDGTSMGSSRLLPATRECDVDLSLGEDGEVTESQVEEGSVAESSFINPREKLANGFGTGFGVMREVGLKRLSDDDLDGDDDPLSKSPGLTPKRRRFTQSLSPGIEEVECQACNEPLPPNFLDTWKNGEFRKGHIPLLEWMDICTEHKAMSLREEWIEKGYPKIDWKGMKKRIESHYKPIEAIIHGEVESPFMAIFQQQEKDVRGNPILLLRKDHRLQYPGYYGPRGANIMLHWLLRRFGNKITARNNVTSNLAHSSAAAFVQAVLVPEVAVRLIMEDMEVTEKRAREVLEESRSIGETLNLKDYQEDIYGTGGNWVDVNSFKN
ncbi:hypothetical protein C7212DRAFT_355457 [Tuber magnatum]|uniref:Restriction of telomere capping protein 4 n=1 Tax=Tuber magnatum TaxID=42249 RepID=A0A317SWG7_9PEZI|nr:hypothetical protein C7212DRAFT_355457 [Tuber magnatum]